MSKVKSSGILDKIKSESFDNKLIRNLLNKPAELKPGQVWLLKQDSNDSLPIEIVLTDTEYASSIGIVRGIALSRVKNAGDVHDVILNKKHYPDTLPNGRVCLRLTNCALPKDNLEFFIDELAANDWIKVNQSLQKKESYHNEPQLNLANHIIERLSLYRNEAIRLYEKWLDSYNELKNVIRMFALYKINRNIQIKSYYGYPGSNLEKTIFLDELWDLVEKNSNNIVNLFEDKKLIVDFIVLKDLPHLIFYSSIKLKIDSVELMKGNKTSKAADNEFSINNNGKFITSLEPKELETGEWTLRFNIKSKPKLILVRIE